MNIVVFAFLLGMYLEVKLMDHMLCEFQFLVVSESFPKWLCKFTLSPTEYEL